METTLLMYSELKYAVFCLFPGCVPVQVMSVRVTSYPGCVLALNQTEGAGKDQEKEEKFTKRLAVKSIGERSKERMEKTQNKLHEKAKGDIYENDLRVVIHND